MAELSHRERVPGARLVWLFPAAPAPVRFTPNWLAELLHRLGMPTSVAGYGNLLACVASLWGPSVEELSAEELDVADPRFPLVAWAHAEKAR